MGAIHEDFDRETLRCFSSSDESLIPYLEKELPRRGNGSEEVRNWLVAHGAALGRVLAERNEGFIQLTVARARQVSLPRWTPPRKKPGGGK